MAQPPRILLPKTVTLLTARVQEGLPFICTDYMNAVISSAVGVAQLHHPITILRFVVMGNHVHILVLVENPEDVADFMERFKTETAHAIAHG